MAKKSGEKPTKPRGKQEHLPGMEPEDIPELTAAAVAYELARDRRIEANKEESDAHGTLLNALEKHDRHAYRSPDGILVTLSRGKVKAKVQRVPQADQVAA